jgi:hypothetical protein
MMTNAPAFNAGWAAWARDPNALNPYRHQPLSPHHDLWRDGFSAHKAHEAMRQRPRINPKPEGNQ